MFKGYRFHLPLSAVNSDWSKLGFLCHGSPGIKYVSNTGFARICVSVCSAQLSAITGLPESTGKFSEESRIPLLVT